MRKLQVVSLLIGVLALVWLVHRIGPDAIAGGMRAIGFGFALTASAHLAGLILDSVTLRACAGKIGTALSLLPFVRASVAGHAINEATPLGKLGEVTKYSILRERLEPTRAAGALVAQNIAMFVVNCNIIALMAPVAIGVFGVGGTMAMVFAIVGSAFFVCGLVGLLILRVGIGQWPFALARRLRLGNRHLPTETIDRWQQGWQRVEATWRDRSGDRLTQVTIWTSAIASRAANLTEAALILYFLGAGDIWAGALISLGGYQLMAWTFSFVPMQAGTAEGGAYVVFRAVGLDPALGVLVELGRRVRRISFVALGVIVLAVSAARAQRAAT